MDADYSRRDFLKKAALGAGLAVAGTATRGHTNLRQNASTHPNVVVIIADDLGYGDLSCYGAKDLQTPNIDNLVAAGVRFDNFYANCSVCSPTRASLLTGRYPDLVGVPGVIRTHITNNFGCLSEHVVLLPRLLKEAGYHTAIVGKWHLGLASPNKPNERGFDHFAGFLGDMMDDYYTHRRHGFNYMRLNEKEIDPKGHATDLFTQWAIDYIGQRAKSNQPFFLYLAYNAPHTPIQPPESWLEKVKKRQNNISDKRAKLVALIEHMDDGIGKVLAALKETGLSDDTLIFFTSDNGGQIGVGADNGPLTGGKGQMYEGGIRVPACAVWPGKINPPYVGRIKPGSRSDYVALTMDLFPTICEVAGVKIEREIDGRSILSTLLAKTQPEPHVKRGAKYLTPGFTGGLPSDDRFLFWVRREGGNFGGRAFYAARHGQWKLLQNSPFEPLELYNLRDDPKEEQPLDRKHPMYRKLFDALRNHIIEAGAVAWQKYPVDPNKQLTH
jgi:arylsulfatase A-like enzyme